MTARIEIDPEVENELVSLAKAKGITVDELLREILACGRLTASGESKSTAEEFEADMLVFAEGTEGPQQEYSGSYSREDIYLDHD